MNPIYGTTAEDIQVVRDRVATMLDLATAQFGSHPLIVGMCVLGIVAERMGRDDLDELIKVARSMRQTLINEEKAEAQAAKRALGKRRAAN